MARDLLQDRSRFLPVVAVVLAIAIGVPVLLATTGGGGGPSTATGGNAVTIQNFEYAPPTITVPVGTEVTWANEDSAPHTASADDGTFDTGTIAGSGESASVTLDEVGTFAYKCDFHAFMRGTVEVEQ